MGVKLKIEKDELTIEEGDNDLIAAMIKGCEGEVTIKCPYVTGGKVKIKKIKDKNGTVLKEKKER